MFALEFDKLSLNFEQKLSPTKCAAFKITQISAFFNKGDKNQSKNITIAIYSKKNPQLKLNLATLTHENQEYCCVLLYSIKDEIIFTKSNNVSVAIYGKLLDSDSEIEFKKSLDKKSVKIDELPKKEMDWKDVYESLILNSQNLKAKIKEKFRSENKSIDDFMKYKNEKIHQRMKTKRKNKN